MRVSPFATALSSPSLLNNMIRATSPTRGPIRREKIGAKNSLAKLAGTRDPISLCALKYVGGPHRPTYRRREDGGRETLNFTGIRIGQDWRPSNFPNHTSARLVGEYGKKKPTRYPGRARARSGGRESRLPPSRSLPSRSPDLIRGGRGHDVLLSTLPDQGLGCEGGRPSS